jgi:hypothetical protein
MKAVNYGFRFLLEVCALIALAYWGATVVSDLSARILLAVAAPIAAGAVWAVFVAPNSTRKLRDPYRLLPELAVFGGAAAGLFTSDHAAFGIALLVLYAVNRAWLTQLEART